MTYARWLLWVGWLGCNKDEPEGSKPEPSCTNSVVERYPEDGAVDVYDRTSVQFVLSEEDSQATLVVTDPDGEQVPGTAVVEGPIATWRGGPLQALTTYQATLSYACGEETASWTTSDWEQPLDFEPEGALYAFEIAQGRWMEPAGLGSLIAAQIGGLQLLAVVRTMGEQELSLAATTSEDTAQDPCVPTTPLQGGWDEPFFEAASEPPVSVLLNGTLHALDKPVLSGAFLADGSRVQGGQLQGLLHTEGLAEAFGAGDQDACQLAESLGSPCEPCLDSVTETCVTIRIEDLQGLRVQGGALADRSQAEIDADPACTTP